MYSARVHDTLSQAGFTATQMPTCHACVDLDKDCMAAMRSTKSSRNAVDVTIVQDGEKAGCPTCTSILSGLRALAGDLQGDATIIFTGLDKTTIHVAAFLDPSKSRYDVDRCRTIDLFTLPNDASPWSFVKPLPVVPHRADSPEGIDFVRRHLQACTSGSSDAHPRCAPYVSKSMPTRVLDVGSETQDPRLVETKGIMDKYAALSHRWGGSHQAITKVANFTSMTAGIPWSCLPQTFRDACTVCRKLGIRYLWIDSLCIIQDSPDDWAKEAALMGNVYADSWLTIAADAAEVSSQSFLQPSSRIHEVISLRTEFPKGGSGTLFMRPEMDFANRDQMAVWDYSVDTGYVLDECEVTHRSAQRDRSALSTRAWVLQERLLAPHTVHYALEETAFECRSGSWCECTLRSRAEHFNGRSRLFKDMLEDEWNWVVLEFTRLSLTYNKDRLPALSGIAAHHQARLKSANKDDRYVAGFWRGDLEQSLLWRIHENEQDSTSISERVKEYVAPSWSWACISGTIHWENTSKIAADFKILEAACVPSGPNPFGSVSSGHITIIGQTVPVRLKADDPTTLSDPLSFQPDTTSHVVSCVDLEDPELSTTNFEPDVRGTSIEVSLNTDYLFLLISDGIPDFGYEPAPAGLILHQQGDDASQYSRVGYASTYIEAEKYGCDDVQADDGDDDEFERRRAELYRRSWDQWAAVATLQTLTIV